MKSRDFRKQRLYADSFFMLTMGGSCGNTESGNDNSSIKNDNTHGENDNSRKPPDN